MKCLIPLLLCALLLCACGAEDALPAFRETPSVPAQTAPPETEVSPMRISLTCNGQTMYAALENNSSAAALYEKLPLTVEMTDYGSFEKVGPLGFELPQNNTQITTTPGDIILYLGTNITVYYDVNSWNFTKLGHVEDATGENMRAFLGTGDAVITFAIAE